MADLDKRRRDTITNLHDLSSALELVLETTDKQKFKDYLKDLKEQVEFSINSNKKIDKRKLKKVYKLLRQIKKHLKHSFWNSGKIKRKMKKINELLGIMI
ncbi:MAG: hypothetical protein K9L26_03660 [Candidatus Izimaplasma sp.]|nr:hypothetical protein [Candidatus Izimaplasma bacterium]